MSTLPGWSNPISVSAGQTQYDVDPTQVLPSRPDLQQRRLDLQRQLLASGQARFTPIQVTQDGVIWDGHHAVRAAAEAGRRVAVLVVAQRIRWIGLRIVDLPVG
jgi:hypothetical protein